MSAEAAVAELYLIHDASLELDPLRELATGINLVALSWSERQAVPAGARVLLCLGDEQLRDLAPLALERRWEVGLLPHDDGKHANDALGVKGSVAQVFKHYLGARAVEVDALTCNDQLVFGSVVIGQVLSLRPYDINRRPSNWSFVRGAFRGLGKLQLRNYRLTTGKDQKIQLAALGLVVLGHTQSSLIGRSFSEDLSINDGRLAMLALAPRSILAYLWYMLRLILPGKISLAKLPHAVGLVQTDRLLLESPEGVDYLLDGKPVHATELEFRQLEQRLLLLPGPALRLRSEAPSFKGKDVVRLKHLPLDEGAKQLTGRHLPLFSHASEEEYRDLFVSLRESATPTSAFQVLTVLSVLLALTGMYANSAPVIIGAMILAPLMSPILSLAMGLARTDSNLIRNATRTLLIGIAWGLLCAVLLAWLMPLDQLTSEMRARTAPTLLDLMVAVISGVAGAYAYAKEEIAKSLAGVAIAVALVPPLSVVGIGIGWGDWVVARGAALLFTTNLIGIALAASATFLVLGFAPFKLARKGLASALVMMLLISVPLYFAFTDLVERGEILAQVPSGEMELLDRVVRIGDVRVQTGDPAVIHVVLSSSTQLDGRHVDALKQLIMQRLDQPLVLEAQLNLRR